MAKSKPLPPLEEIRAEFDYDPATGLFRHAYRKGDRGSRGLKGDIAGGITANGYIFLKSKNWRVLAHRAAWALAHNMDPFPRLIDHIDGDKTNNAASNLRIALSAENNKNISHAKGWERLPSGNYRTRIEVDKKKIHIGTFSTAEEAEEAYRKKAVELRGEFAPQAWK